MAQIRSKPFGVTKEGANVTEYTPVSYTHLTLPTNSLV